MPSTGVTRINGLTTSVAVKAPCKVIATTPITLNGVQTIDGVTLQPGGNGVFPDRVLVNGQADARDNGIYEVNTMDWQRAGDFDGARDAVQGTLVFVGQSNSEPNALWILATADNPINFGISLIRFIIAPVSSAVTALACPDGTLVFSNPTGTINATLAPLPNGKILVGNLSNVATAQTISGDGSINNTGSLTITKTNGVSLGTMATQNASAVAITGGTATGLPSPTGGSDVATKTYVDSVAAGGLVQKAACAAATTANLSATYSNGTLGVGATLTNNSTQAAFAVDVYSASLNDRILVKDQSSQANNGIYTVTTVGDGSHNWVLTRATDFDQAAEVSPSDFVVILNGTANGGKLFIETALGPFTMGTTAITFALFGGGAQTITFTGDIGGSGTGTIATTIANSAVTTAKIAANAITNAKMAAGTANTIAGWDATTAFAGISAGANLLLSGGILTTNNTIYNVRDYGAVGDGSTDDTAAFIACKVALLANARGGVFYIPAGKYLISSGISATLSSQSKSFIIKGDGPFVSMIYWTGTSGTCMSITFPSARYSAAVQCDGVAFWCNTANGGTALALISNNRGNPGPVKRVSNCVFTGDHSTTYWTTCINFDGCTYIDLVSCRFDGNFDGSAFHGTGITIQTTFSTDHDYGAFVTNCFFWDIGIGANIGPYLEGIQFMQSSFGGGTGITMNATDGPPVLVVIGCGFEQTTYCIQTENVTQMVICDSQFYCDTGATAIFVNDSTSYGTNDGNIICNNRIAGVGASGNGIVMTRAAYSRICGNIIDNLTTGIWLEPNTANNTVKDNQITNCTNYILDQGTANNIGLAVEGMHALVYMAAAQTIPNGVWTAASFGTADYDPLVMWNGATRLTVPAGVTKVKLQTNVTIDLSGGSGGMRVRIRKNGVSFPSGTFIGSPDMGAALSSQLNISSPILRVVAGDYFEVEAIQSSGSTANIAPTNAKNQQETWFSMEIVA